ncbi:MAG: hypothetical protein K8R41_09170 [Bacteroidales bacterium]|nr:hypothetical protein [Bacteroidales bacterium]
MKIVFFKRSKPKAFEYKPLYYDKKKDDREKRKRELGLDNSHDSSAMMKGELQRRWRKGETNTKEKTSSMKFVIYLLIAIMSVYLIFFTDLVQKIVQIFIPN